MSGTLTPIHAKWLKAQGRRNRPPKPPEPPKIVEPLFTILTRKKVMVPTDNSQRRCYNGCFPSSDWEWVWDAWEELEVGMPASRIDFWKDLGKLSTKVSQYKLLKEGQSLHNT